MEIAATRALPVNLVPSDEQPYTAPVPTSSATIWQVQVSKLEELEYIADCLYIMTRACGMQAGNGHIAFPTARTFLGTRHPICIPPGELLAT